MIELNIKAFAVALSTELCKRGIDKETAVSNVLRITRSLAEDDLKEIASYKSAADFTELAEALVRLIEDEQRAAIVTEGVAEPVVISDMETGTKRIPIGSTGHLTQSNVMAETRKVDAAYALRKEHTEPVDATRLNLPPVAPIPHTYEDIDATRINMATAAPSNAPVQNDATRVNMTPAPEAIKHHYTEYKEVELTPRGKKFFWTGFALTLPITLLITIAFFGLYALCMASVAALIVACFAIVGVIVILGSLICLVGIVFGVITIFTSLGIGIYEIGVGIVVSGVTLLLGVGVYLLATVALPYILRQLSAFFRHTLAQVPTLLDRIKEECNHL